MRAYFFGNMYLSSIQQGIQAAHCTANMFLKYHPNSADPEMVVEINTWAGDHKTMILLNGGDHHDLAAISAFMTTDNPYPWAEFKESMPALNGAVTCVGIVLPANIYEGAEATRKAAKDQYIPVGLFEFTNWEREFITILNKCGLAR